MAGETPSVDEVRRAWGLAVDVHRRPERLAAFDRMIAAEKAQAWFEGWDAESDWQSDLDFRTIPDVTRQDNPYITKED